MTHGANMPTEAVLKIPMSLETIPAEIQSLILESLCPHCFFGTLDLSWEFDHDLKCRRRAVKALALTSKRLRRVALPVMVHEARAQLSLGAIFRLFDSQPYLASHMRHFQFNMSKRDKGRSLEFLEPRARKIYGELVDGIDFEEVKNDAWKAEVLVAELFMSLAPNISAVSVEVRENNRHNRSEWDCVPTPFPKLQLRSARGFRAAKWLKLVNPRECFTGLSHPFLNAILSDMPNLDSLSCHGIPGYYQNAHFNFHNSREALTSLRTMEFQGCAFSGTFEDTDFDILREMLLYAAQVFYHLVQGLQGDFFPVLKV